jgi:hypothetical protein
LRHFGLNDGGKYAHSEAAGHAVDVFKACLKLPITLKQNQRLKAPHGEGDPETINSIKTQKER